MEYRFCPVCGSRLEQVERKGRVLPTCPKDGYIQAQEVGVAAIVRRGDQVLLERRAVQAGYGLWALPGGMIEAEESLEDALAREVLEETGIAVAVGRLLGARGGRFTTIIFYEACPSGGELTRSDESLEVAWVPVAEIPWDSFAFPRHRDMLAGWIKQQEWCGKTLPQGESRRNRPQMR